MENVRPSSAARFAAATIRSAASRAIAAVSGTTLISGSIAGRNYSGRPGLESQVSRAAPRRGTAAGLPGLRHLVRRLGEVVVDGLLFRLVAAEGEEDHVVVDPGLQVHRALPDPVEVLQRLDGELDLDVEPVVLVGQVQLAAVAVVAVHHVDERLAHVGQVVEHRLLDALRVAADDAELARVGVAAVLVELVLLDELGGHEFVDEVHVVVDPPDLEDLLAAEPQPLVPALLLADVVRLLVLLAELALVPPVLDVAEQLDADLV